MKTRFLPGNRCGNTRLLFGLTLGVLLTLLGLSVNPGLAVARARSRSGPSDDANLISAASRVAQGGAGSFDVDMPLIGASGVEDRLASQYTAVFTFDVPVTSGEVTVASGVATVGAITFEGNEMRAALSDVADIQTVVLHPQNINGDGLPHGDVPFGFLAADVDSDRTVDGSDKKFIKVHQGAVTGENFRGDVNNNGTVDLADGLVVRSKKRNTLP